MPTPVLGLDAGGSNTRVLTAEIDTNANPRKTCDRLLGPGNFRHLGRDGVAALVREAVDSCAIVATADWMVVGGFAGAGTAASRNAIRAAFIAHGFAAERVHVTNDGGLLLDAIGEGIVLIAGTGSLCMGRRTGGDGDIRAGGYGYRMPSETGGYFLGIHAIDVALQVADGRRQDDSALREVVMNHLGIASPVEITPLLYPEGGTAAVQEKVAALAPRVLDVAGGGDQAAAGLVDQVVGGMAEHLLGVYRRLGLDRPLVGLHGGLFADPHADLLLLEPLRRHPLLRDLGLRLSRLAPPGIDPLLAAMSRQALAANG